MNSVEESIIQFYKRMLEEGNQKDAHLLRKETIQRIYFGTDNPLSNDTLLYFLEQERLDIVASFGKINRTVNEHRSWSCINALLTAKLNAIDNVFDNGDIYFLSRVENRLFHQTGWQFEINQFIIHFLVGEYNCEEHYKRMYGILLDGLYLRNVLEEGNDNPSYLEHRETIDAAVEDKLGTMVAEGRHITERSFVTCLYLSTALINFFNGRDMEGQFFLSKLENVIEKNDRFYPVFQFLKKEYLLQERA